MAGELFLYLQVFLSPFRCIDFLLCSSMFLKLPVHSYPQIPSPLSSPLARLGFTAPDSWILPEVTETLQQQPLIYKYAGRSRARGDNIASPVLWGLSFRRLRVWPAGSWGLLLGAHPHTDGSTANTANAAVVAAELQLLLVMLLIIISLYHLPLL